MPWRRVLITLAIIASIIGVLAFGFSRDPRYIHTPLLGHQAPSFTFTLFDGKTLSLGDLKGKVVFLNFWASWCPPCRAEARELEAEWKKVQDKEVVFLGVNMQDTVENASAFLQEFGITYPNGRDEDGKISIDYGVWGIPETFFIDPKGKITYKHVGMLGRSIVEGKLEEARRSLVSANEGKGEYEAIR